MLGFLISQESASPTLGLSPDAGEMTGFPGILGVFRSRKMTTLTLLRSVVAWVWTLLHCYCCDLVCQKKIKQQQHPVPCPPHPLPNQWLGVGALPLGVPNESFPPQSCLTPSPPGGLYNVPAPTSVPRFTQAGSMLLLPVLLAASSWSRKPHSLSPIFAVCGEHCPCSRLQPF